MKIGIISEALNHPLTGIGNYVSQLVDQQNKILAPGDSIVLINNQKNSTFPNDNILVPNIIPYFKTFPWYLTLPGKLKIHKELDIIHNPAQFPTFFRFHCKNIITVHDITPLLFPKEHIFGVPSFFKLFLPNTLKNADLIISDSNNTKQDLIFHLKVPEDKIEIIPLAADPIYRIINWDDIDKIKQKFNIRNPYILCLGTLEPRKNLPLLIRAFASVKKSEPLLKLLIVGGKGWKYSGIFDLVNSLGINQDVVFLGYLAKVDLPALYGGAEVFIYPSLYEGFGLPPLEAMACGCPVIVSNSSSLPEVVHDAGLLVDPANLSELVMLIKKVINDASLRDEMRKKGIERAKFFSWEKTAKLTYDIYKQVI